MTPRLRKKASQAQVVGAFIGTLALLQSEVNYLPHSVLADVAARLVPLMDFEGPMFVQSMPMPIIPEPVEPEPEPPSYKGR